MSKKQKKESASAGFNTEFFIKELGLNNDVSKEDLLKLLFEQRTASQPKQFNKEENSEQSNNPQSTQELAEQPLCTVKDRAFAEKFKALPKPKSTSVRRISSSPRSRKRTSSHSSVEQQPVTSRTVPAPVVEVPSATYSSGRPNTTEKNSYVPATSQPVVNVKLSPESSKHGKDCDDKRRQEKTTLKGRRKKRSQSSHDEDPGPTNHAVGEIMSPASLPETLEMRNLASETTLCTNQSPNSKHGKDSSICDIKKKTALKGRTKRRSQSSHNEDPGPSMDTTNHAVSENLPPAGTPETSEMRNLAPGTSFTTQSPRSKHGKDSISCDIKKKTALKGRTKRRSQSSHDEDPGPSMDTTNHAVSENLPPAGTPETSEMRNLAPGTSFTTQSPRSKHGKDSISCDIKKKTALKGRTKRRSQSSHDEDPGPSMDTTNHAVSENLPPAGTPETSEMRNLAPATSSCTTQSTKSEHGNDSSSCDIKKQTTLKGRAKKHSRLSYEEDTGLPINPANNDVNLPPVSIVETLETRKSAPDTSSCSNQSPNSKYGNNFSRGDIKKKTALKRRMIKRSCSSPEHDRDSSMDLTNHAVCENVPPATVETSAPNNLSPVSLLDLPRHSKATQPVKRKSLSSNDSPGKRKKVEPNITESIPNEPNSLHSNDLPTYNDFNLGSPCVVLTRLSLEEIQSKTACKAQSQDLVATNSPTVTERKFKPMPKSRKLMMQNKSLVKDVPKVDSPSDAFGEKSEFLVPKVPVAKKLNPAFKRKTGTNIAAKLNCKPDFFKSPTVVPRKAVDVVETEPLDSSDLFRNFHKPPVCDPMEKLKIENEELDFEPGIADDDDTLSIYADSTIFQSVYIRDSEEIVSTVHASVNDASDVDSVASYGSDDSRRLSDMEDDSDNEGNFKRKGTVPGEYESVESHNTESLAPVELGFPVEDYDAEDVGRNIKDSVLEARSDVPEPENDETDFSCMDMSVCDDLSDQTSVIQQSCPKEKEDCEVQGQVGNDTLINTGSSLTSDHDFNMRLLEPTSLISADCAVSQSNMLYDELSPRSGTAGLGANHHVTLETASNENEKEGNQNMENLSQQVLQPNLSAAEENAENTSLDVAQNLVSHGSELAHRQACAGIENVTLHSARPLLDVTKQLPDQNRNMGVFGKQRDMEREMERQKRRVHNSPSHIPAGVHFSPPKRVYPDNERPGLLPTPGEMPVSLCTPEKARIVDQETGGNPPLPNPSNPDLRSSQHVYQERPPLLPDPAKRPLGQLDYERGRNLKAAPLLRDPPRSLDHGIGRNQRAPPLLYNPAGPPRPYPSSSLHHPNPDPEASPSVNVPHYGVAEPSSSITNTQSTAAPPVNIGRHTDFEVPPVIYRQFGIGIPNKPMDNSVLGNPTEALLNIHYNMSLKDTDLRPRNIDLRSQKNAYPHESNVHGSSSRGQDSGVDLSQHCKKYLACGNCVNEPTCNLLHSLPTVRCVEIRQKSNITEIIRDMVTKYEFWMSKAFSSLVKDLGTSNEKVVIMSVCEILWERDLQLQDKTKLIKNSGQWEITADALCDCGLSPSKSVRQILHRVVTFKNNYDVLDNMVEALYPKFIKDQSLLWTALQKLTKVEGYEMPDHILIEILRDTITHKKRREHDEICNYLLSIPSPRLLEPRDVVDKNMRDRIHTFIHIYTTENKEAAGKLSEYLSMSVTNDCCGMVCTNRPIQSRLGGRFRLQSNVPRFSAKNNCGSPRNSGNKVVKGSPQNVNSGTMPTLKPTLEAQVSERKGNAQEEEVTSSTGEFIAVPAAQVYQEVEGETVALNTHGSASMPVSGNAPEPPAGKGSIQPPSRGVQKMQFEKIKIMVKGSDRVPYYPDTSEPSQQVSSEKSTSKSELSGEHPRAKDNAPRSRQQKPDIQQLISNKTFAKAAAQIVEWVKPELVDAGVIKTVKSFNEFKNHDRIKYYQILLRACYAHFEGFRTSILPKSAIARVGLEILQEFLTNGLYKEADEMHKIIWEKVNFDEVQIPLSPAAVLLLSAVVHLQNNKINEALKIVTENNFSSCPNQWTCRSDPIDSETRDFICKDLIKQCREVEAFLPQAELLLRSMLDAKDSYKFDVGAELLDKILCSLARAGLGKIALDLLLWAASNHNIVPQNEVTNRLLLTQINVMSEEDQKIYSPQVLLILHEEPYKNALPKSIVGVPRVLVSLQSIWFACEVRCIIKFLLNCHCANLPAGQEIPQISITIKEVSLPPVTSDTDFPCGLRAVDPSLSAMQERVQAVLQGPFELITERANFLNGTIDLDPRQVQEYVDNRRRSLRGLFHQAQQPHVNESRYQNHQGGIEGGYQNHPGGNEAGYQNHPGGNEAGYQFHPGGNEAGYQNHPGGNEAGYQNHPGGNEAGYQNHPGGNEAGYQNRPGRSWRGPPHSGREGYISRGGPGGPPQPSSGFFSEDTFGVSIPQVVEHQYVPHSRFHGIRDGIPWHSQRGSRRSRGRYPRRQ